MSKPSRKTQEGLRNIPSIARLLDSDAAKALTAVYSRGLVVQGLQTAVSAIRTSVLDGESTTDTQEGAIIEMARQWIETRGRSSLRRVINATGVVLHTGLGRAPLSDRAVRAVAQCAAGYSNLELDLATGARGRRADHVAGLLTELTGAQAATVVNNNAAATLLILNTVASGRDVIVSRGELVEIGGAYRLPEMMTSSGARLKEVGTTNRTRITDYQRAITDNTAALMKVHTSNYRVTGFSESTPLDQLVELGKRIGLPVIHDLGSGAMFDVTTIGAPHEPNVRDSIASGVDLICFSGDKVLGGPQAGIILGRQDLIGRIESNSLARTYRVDKMTLAALEATLTEYRDTKSAVSNIPSLAMLSCDKPTLMQRAEALAIELQNVQPGGSFEIVEDLSVAGGGSMPGQTMATYCVAWKPANCSVDDALSALRAHDPAVVARARDDAVLFDLRTVQHEDIPIIASAVVARND